MIIVHGIEGAKVLIAIFGSWFVILSYLQLIENNYKPSSGEWAFLYSLLFFPHLALFSWVIFCSPEYIFLIISYTAISLFVMKKLN